METTIITTVQSAISAQRVLEEIALAGKYAIVGRGDYVVYERVNNNKLEKLSIRKIDERKYEVVKEVRELSTIDHQFKK